MPKRIDPLKIQEWNNFNRRDFLATSASGIGMAALASLMQQDNLLANSNNSFISPDDQLNYASQHEVTNYQTIFSTLTASSLTR